MYPSKPIYKIGQAIVAETFTDKKHTFVVFVIDTIYRDRKLMQWVYVDFDEKYAIPEIQVAYKVKNRKT